MSSVLKFSTILLFISFFKNTITVATAHGLSSDKDKCILNFWFLNFFFSFFKEFPNIFIIGAPCELFLISTSLKFKTFFEPMALKRASFAANLFAKHSILFFFFFTFIYFRNSENSFFKGSPFFKAHPIRFILTISVPIHKYSFF